ncbi:MAG: hypothetical protein AM326_03040 [Candidatus Thorarchaeota archaeon SMTZ-45]|nr:MAG: hypothetical protein AM326_03040 [Candidatus Thorarchaeota archaeon SMTZ-45]
MSKPELSGIPPIWTREDVEALRDHALEGIGSFMIRKDGSNFEAIYNSGPNLAGTLLAAATSTDALATFQAVESVALVNQTIHIKHADYNFSAKWEPAKKLRLIGEGLGTRLLPDGAFDAIDTTNLSLLNLVWRDADSVDHDACLDPSYFEPVYKSGSYGRKTTFEDTYMYEQPNPYNVVGTTQKIWSRIWYWPRVTDLDILNLAFGASFDINSITGTLLVSERLTDLTSMNNTELQQSYTSIGTGLIAADATQTIDHPTGGLFDPYTIDNLKVELIFRMQSGGQSAQIANVDLFLGCGEMFVGNQLLMKLHGKGFVLPSFVFATLGAAPANETHLKLDTGDGIIGAWAEKVFDSETAGLFQAADPVDRKVPLLITSDGLIVTGGVTTSQHQVVFVEGMSGVFTR